MAPRRFQCLTPGCSFETEELEPTDAIEFLKLHTSQNHGVTSKPEKPKKPVLEMATNTIDTLDWEAFIHKFSVYKKLSGITGDAGSHFLDFWKRGLFCFIQHIWGRNELTE